MKSKKKRIVVTGIGVLSPLGIQKEAFWTSLINGKNGIDKLRTFDVSQYDVRYGGEVSGYSPSEDFSRRELSCLDRASIMLIKSSKDALNDANIFINEENSSRIGVSIGTMFGSLSSLSEFDKVSVTDGPRYVNPAHFPQTVPNLPASQISIYHKIKGFNVTLSSGICASFDAIDYAINAIRNYNHNIVLTGGVEEMCEQTFLGLYTLKLLALAKKRENALSRPFDAKRNGIIYSEGSGILILEDLDSAILRNAEIYGEILSLSSNFDSFRFNKYNPQGVGMVRAMEDALDKANLDPSDIDYVCANANSSKDADLIEAKSIKKVFGRCSIGNVPVTSIKSMIGESFSASGIMSCIAGLGSFLKDFIPPTINFCSSSQSIDLNIVRETTFNQKIKTILINSFGQDGSNSSLILKKYIE